MSSILKTENFLVVKHRQKGCVTNNKKLCVTYNICLYNYAYIDNVVLCYTSVIFVCCNGKHGRFEQASK